jgi:hypothetical protein
MDRNFFEGYISQINVNEFFDAMNYEKKPINLVPLFRSTVKNFVEERTLVVKEFELDLYKMEDGRHVIHICRREGAENYCDYYVFDEVHRSLQYRIFRAIIGESLEPYDIHFEFTEHAGDLCHLAAALAAAGKIVVRD